MKVYLLKQNTVTGYDTFDSCVVVAKNEQEARKIHPSVYATHVTDNRWMGTYTAGNNIGGEFHYDNYNWVPYSRIDEIIITEIGTAKKGSKAGLVLASFNAG